MGVKYLPWWAKIGGKIVLSRLPISYTIWRKLGLFQHGYMHYSEYAIRTFEANFHCALEHGWKPPVDFHALELGPGDSILSAILTRANGAGKTYLVDEGTFADTGLAVCQQVAQMMIAQGKKLPDITKTKNLEGVLDCMKASYLTQGTSSLAEIPDASIDFFWSQAVLEHISRREFPALVKALRRIISPAGIGVHVIDFRDHLGGGLNNLRFSEKVWEGRLFKDSGFYTNRLRPHEMLTTFKQEGFSIEVIEQRRWPQMPISRDKLAPEFRQISDENFMISGMKILVHPGI